MPLKDRASPDQLSEVSLPASPPVRFKEVCKLIHSSSMQISIQHLYPSFQQAYLDIIN